MATVNELKAELTKLGIEFNEDAKKDDLLELLEAGVSEDSNAEGTFEDDEKEIEETDTHWRGEDGRWYRKKEKPLPQVPLHECNTFQRKVSAGLKVQQTKALMKEAKAFLKANKGTGKED